MTSIPIHRQVLIRALERVIGEHDDSYTTTYARKRVLQHLKNSSDPDIFPFIMVDLQDFVYFGLDKFAPDQPVREVGLGSYEQG